MKAFTVTRFDHNLITGQVFVDYCFSTKGEVKPFAQVFKDLPSARAYVDACKRDWLLGALDDYVNHKRHIIEAGRHYNQDKPLQICQNALADFHTRRQSLQNICTRFLAGYAWFETILPAPQNSSYLSSCETLAVLKNFCQTCLPSKP